MLYYHQKNFSVSKNKMKKQITPKQLEILILLYRYRFLNRTQIQTLLNHKNTKCINTWLKDLNDKKIIGRHYIRSTTENTKPAIYYLMTKSKNLLIGQSGVDGKLLIKRVYREKIRSQRLIGHSIFLANFYLDLVKNVKDEKIHFFTKTDLATYDYLPTKCPDAYIAKKGKTMKRYFLEIIDEGFPRFMIRKKIEEYIEYYQAKIWQEKTNYPFPSILIFCPNEMIKNFMHKYLSQVIKKESDAKIDFYLSIKNPTNWVNTLEEITPEDN